MGKVKEEKQIEKVLNFRVIIEQDEDGIFIASVPALRGCHTEGDTYEEAIENIKDAIMLYVEVEKEEQGDLIDDSGTEFIGIKNISIPDYAYGISSHNQTTKTHSSY